MPAPHTKLRATGALLTAGAPALAGLLLLLWPASSARLICALLGAVLAASGAGDILAALSSGASTPRSAARLTLGAALAGVGLWLMARPPGAASVAARGAGALICVHGCGSAGTALALRRGRSPRWGAALAMACTGLLLGLLLVLWPERTGGARAAGLALVYDGISCGWISLQACRQPPEGD